MPFTLSEAISAALRWLQFEDLPHEERPPKHLWLSDKLGDWWKEIERKRRKKYGLPEEDDDDYDDRDPGSLGVNTVELVTRG